jgi:ataxia telangiectasia mutated family protein
MAEIFLDKTISLLSSDKQKARSDGLAGLSPLCKPHAKKGDY